MARLIREETASPAVTEYFVLYFFDSSPFISCPVPYAKKKKELTRPAVDFSTPRSETIETIEALKFSLPIYAAV